MSRRTTSNAGGWTEAESLEASEAILDGARNMFDAVGEVPLNYYLLATRPKKGIVLVALSHELYVDMKAGFAAEVRRQAVRFGALGSIMVSECWTVGRDANEVVGPISDQTDRQEVICVALEHQRYQSRAWMGVITRDANGRGSLGPWTERLIGRGGVMGDNVPAVS